MRCNLLVVTVAHLMALCHWRKQEMSPVTVLATWHVGHAWELPPSQEVGIVPETVMLNS